MTFTRTFLSRQKSSRVRCLLLLLLCLPLVAVAQPSADEDGMPYLRQQLREAQDLGDRAKQSAVYQEMALLGLLEHREADAMSSAQMAVDIVDTPSEEARLTLALVCMQVDSLSLAKRQIGEVLHGEAPSVKSISTAYRYLLRIAVAEGRDDEALALTDSVCQWDDRLLEASQQLNHAFSQEMDRKDNEVARREAKRHERLLFTAAIAIVSLVLLLFLLYLFQMRRRIYRYERALAEQKREAEALLQAEKLRHHEDQISAMRSFLDHKVDTIQRIEMLKEGASQHFILTDQDWQELEGFLDSVEDLFVKRLRERFPALTDEAVHLMMLLRLRMPTRSLAIVYGISEKSVKQKLFVYKERVGLKGERTSLRDFIQAF